jgi:hypothetical protein
MGAKDFFIETKLLSISYFLHNTGKLLEIILAIHVYMFLLRIIPFVFFLSLVVNIFYISPSAPSTLISMA